MTCYCGKTALYIRGSGKKAGRCREHKDVLTVPEKEGKRGQKRKTERAAEAAEAATT